MSIVYRTRLRIEKSRWESLADNACTIILVIATAYFIGITLHAAWLGRFSQAAIEATR
jgi:hypothetical protein